MLESIDLRNKNLTGFRGAKELAESLKANPHATSLDLSEGNKLGKGASLLAGAIKGNSSITSLYIANNEILDDGGRAVADSLTFNENVQVLDLSGNSLGPDAAISFAKVLSKNRSIRNLVLAKNPITDDGAKALASSFPSARSLKSIDIRNCDISTDVISIVKAAAASAGIALLIDNLPSGKPVMKSSITIPNSTSATPTSGTPRRRGKSGLIATPVTSEEQAGMSPQSLSSVPVPPVSENVDTASLSPAPTSSQLSDGQLNLKDRIAADIYELQREFDSARKSAEDELQACRNDVAAAVAAISTDSNDKQMRRIAELESEVDQLTEKANGSRGLVDMLCNETFPSYQKAADDEIATLRSTVDQLQDIILEQEDAIQSIKREMDPLLEELQILRNRQQEQVAMLKEAATAVACVKVSSDQVDDRADAVRDQLRGLRDADDRCCIANARIEELLRELECEKKSHLDDVAKWQENSAKSQREHDDEIVAINNEHALKLGAYEDEIASLGIAHDQKVASLVTSHDIEVQKIREEMAKTEAQLCQEIENLTEAVVRLEIERDEAVANEQQTRRENSALVAERDELRDRAAVMAKQSSERYGELAKAFENVKSAEEQLESDMNLVDVELKDVARVETEIGEELQSVYFKNADLEEELQLLALEREELERRCASLEKSRNEGCTAVSELTAKLAEMELDRDQSIKLGISLATSDLNDDIAKLNAEIDRLRSENARLEQVFTKRCDDLALSLGAQLDAEKAANKLEIDAMNIEMNKERESFGLKLQTQEAHATASEEALKTRFSDELDSLHERKERELIDMMQRHEREIADVSNRLTKEIEDCKEAKIISDDVHAAEIAAIEMQLLSEKDELEANLLSEKLQIVEEKNLLEEENAILAKGLKRVGEWTENIANDIVEMQTVEKALGEGLQDAFSTIDNQVASLTKSLEIEKETLAMTKRSLASSNLQLEATLSDNDSLRQCCSIAEQKAALLEEFVIPDAILDKTVNLSTAGENRRTDVVSLLDNFNRTSDLLSSVDSGFHLLSDSFSKLQLQCHASSSKVDDLVEKREVLKVDSEAAMLEMDIAEDFLREVHAQCRKLEEGASAIQMYSARIADEKEAAEIAVNDLREALELSQLRSENLAKDIKNLRGVEEILVAERFNWMEKEKVMSEELSVLKSENETFDTSNKRLVQEVLVLKQRNSDLSDNLDRTENDRSALASEMEKIKEIVGLDQHSLSPKLLAISRRELQISETLTHLRDILKNLEADRDHLEDLLLSARVGCAEIEAEVGSKQRLQFEIDSTKKEITAATPLINDAESSVISPRRIIPPPVSGTASDSIDDPPTQRLLQLEKQFSSLCELEDHVDRQSVESDRVKSAIKKIRLDIASLVADQNAVKKELEDVLNREQHPSYAVEDLKSDFDSLKSAYEEIDSIHAEELKALQDSHGSAVVEMEQQFALGAASVSEELEAQKNALDAAIAENKAHLVAVLENEKKQLCQDLEMAKGENAMARGHLEKTARHCEALTTGVTRVLADGVALQDNLKEAGEEIERIELGMKRDNAALIEQCAKMAEAVEWFQNQSEDAQKLNAELCKTRDDLLREFEVNRRALEGTTADLTALTSKEADVSKKLSEVTNDLQRTEIQLQNCIGRERDLSVALAESERVSAEYDAAARKAETALQLVTSVNAANREEIQAQAIKIEELENEIVRLSELERSHRAERDAAMQEKEYLASRVDSLVTEVKAMTSQYKIMFDKMTEDRSATDEKIKAMDIERSIELQCRAEQINELGIQNTILEGLKSDLQKQLTQSQSESDTLKSELRLLKSNLDDVSKRETAVRREKQMLETRCATGDAEVSRLLEEQKVLRQRLGTCLKENSELQQQNYAEKAEKENVTLQMVSAQGRERRLQKDLQAVKAQLDAVEAQKAELERVRDDALLRAEGVEVDINQLWNQKTLIEEDRYLVSRERDAAKKQSKELENNLRTTTSDLEATDASLQATSKQLNELRASHHELLASEVTLTKSLNDLTQAHAIKCQEYDSLEQIHSILSEDHSNLRSTEIDLEAKHSVVTEELNCLRKEESELRKECKDLNNQLITERSQCDALRNRLIEVEGLLTASSKASDSLQGRLLSEERDLKSSESKLHIISEELSKAANSLAESKGNEARLIADFDRVKHDLTVSEQTADRLNADLQATRYSLSDMTNSRAEAQKMLGELEVQWKDAIDRVEELELACQRLVEELTEAKLVISDLRQLKNSTEQALVESQEDFDLEHDRAEALTTEIITLRQTVEDLTLHIANLKRDLTDLKESSEKEISYLLQRCVDFTTRLQDVEQAIAVICGNIADRESLRNRCMDLDQHISRLNEDVDTLTALKGSLESAISRLESDVARSKAVEDEIKSENKTLMGAIDRIGEDNKRLAREKDEVSTSTRKLESEIEELSRRCENLHSAREKDREELGFARGELEMFQQEKKEWMLEKQSLGLQSVDVISKSGVEVAMANENIRRLEGVVENLGHQKDSLTGELAAASLEINRLRSEWSSASARATTAISEAEAAREVCAEIRRQKENIDSDRLQAREALANAKSELLQDKDKIQRLSIDLENCLARAITAEARLSDVALASDNETMRELTIEEAINSAGDMRRKSDALDSRLDVHRTVLSRLENERHRLEKEQENGLANFNRCKAEVANGRLQVAQQDESLSECNALGVRLRSEIQRLLSENESLRSRCERASCSLTTAESEQPLTTTVQSLTDELNMQASVIASMQSRSAELAIENANLVSSRNSVEVDLVCERSNVKDAEGSLNEVNLRCADLTESLNVEREQLKRARNEISQLREGRSEDSKKITSLLDDVEIARSDFVKNLTKMDLMGKDLALSCEEYNSNSLKAQQLERELGSHISSSKEMISQRDAIIAESEKKLSDVQTEFFEALQVSENQITISREEIQRQCMLVSDLQGKLDDESKQVSLLREDLQNLKNSLVSAEAEVSQKSELVHELTTHISELRSLNDSHIQELMSSIESSNQSISDYNSKLTKARDDVCIAMNENNELRDRLAKSEESLDGAEEKLVALESDNQQLRQNNARAEEEVSKFRDIIAGSNTNSVSELAVIDAETKLAKAHEEARNVLEEEAIRRAKVVAKSLIGGYRRKAFNTWRLFVIRNKATLKDAAMDKAEEQMLNSISELKHKNKIERASIVARGIRNSKRVRAFNKWKFNLFYRKEQERLALVDEQARLTAEMACSVEERDRLLSLLNSKKPEEIKVGDIDALQAQIQSLRQENENLRQSPASTSVLASVSCERCDSIEKESNKKHKNRLCMIIAKSLIGGSRRKAFWQWRYWVSRNSVANLQEASLKAETDLLDSLTQLKRRNKIERAQTVARALLNSKQLRSFNKWKYLLFQKRQLDLISTNRDLEQHRIAMEELSAEHDALRSSVDKTIAERVSDISVVTAELETAQKELKAARADQAISEDALNAEVSRLSKECASLQAELSTLQHALIDARPVHEALIGRLAKVDGELVATKEECLRNEEQLAKCNHTIGRLESDLQRISAERDARVDECTSWREALEASNLQANRAEKRLDEQFHVAEQLRSDVSLLNSCLTVAEAEKMDAVNRCSSLTAVVSEEKAAKEKALISSGLAIEERQDAKAELLRLSNQLVTNEQKLAEMTNLEESHRKMVIDLVKELTSANAELSSYKDQLLKARNDSANDVAKITRDVTNLKDEVQKAAIELSSSEVERGRLKTELDSALGREASERQNRENLENTVNRLNGDLDELKREKDDLNVQNDRSDAEKHALESELANLRTTISTLSSLNDHLKSDVSRLVDTADNLAKQKEAIQSFSETVRSEKDTLLMERNALVASKESVENVLSNTVVELEKVRSERDRLEKEFWLANSEAKNALEERDCFADELSEYKMQHESMEDTIARLEAEVASSRDNANCDRELFENMKQSLIKDGDAQTAEIAALSSENKSLLDKVTIVQKERDDLEKSWSNLRSDHSDASDEKKALVNEVADLRRVRDVLIKEGKNIAADRDALLADNSELSERVAATLSVCEQLEGDCAQQRAAFTKSQMHCDALREENNALRARVDKTAALCSQLQEECEILREEEDRMIKESANYPVDIAAIQKENQDAWERACASRLAADSVRGELGSRCKTLASDLARAEEALKEEKTTKKALVKEMARLEKLALSKDADSSELKAERERSKRLSAEVETLRKIEGKLNSELDAVRRDRAHVDSELSRLRTVVSKSSDNSSKREESLQRTVEQLERENKDLTQSLEDSQSLSDQIERLMKENSRLRQQLQSESSARDSAEDERKATVDKRKQDVDKYRQRGEKIAERLSSSMAPSTSRPDWPANPKVEVLRSSVPPKPK